MGIDLKDIIFIWGKLKKKIETNKEKDKTIKKLEDALEMKGKMKCDHSAYWIIDDQDNIIDGPFCTNCFDNEQIKRRLVQGGKPNGEVGRPWEWVQCPKCGKSFRQKQVGVYLNTH